MKAEVGTLRTRVTGSDGPSAGDAGGGNDSPGPSYADIARHQEIARRIERDRARTRAEGLDD